MYQYFTKKHTLLAYWFSTLFYFAHATNQKELHNNIALQTSTIKNDISSAKKVKLTGNQNLITTEIAKKVKNAGSCYDQLYSLFCRFNCSFLKKGKKVGKGNSANTKITNEMDVKGTSCEDSTESKDVEKEQRAIDIAITNQLQKKQNSNKNNILKKFTRDEINKIKLDIIHDCINNLVIQVNENTKKLMSYSSMQESNKSNKKAANQEKIDQGNMLNCIEELSLMAAKRIDNHSQANEASKLMHLVNISSINSNYTEYSENIQKNKQTSTTTPMLNSHYNNYSNKSTTSNITALPDYLTSKYQNRFINVIEEENTAEEHSMKVQVTPNPPYDSDDEKNFTILNYPPNNKTNNSLV